MNSSLQQLIYNKAWKRIVEEFNPLRIAVLLSYSEAMHLANDLFNENELNNEIQQFALRMFFNIRDNNLSEWDKDWKNDAYLGLLCGMSYHYDEQYECLKKAYDKLDTHPKTLLLLLAHCNYSPGVPPVSEEEKESYLKKAGITSELISINSDEITPDILKTL